MALSDILDDIDGKLCRTGILRPMGWDRARSRLYAGRVSRALPQFKTHVGVTPFDSSTRNIRHDIRAPFPIPDGSIEAFQSEDVFEHIPYGDLLPIVEEIHRVLKPGGLFRLSVPDYRCPILLRRSTKAQDGQILFDPGGGGSFVDGRVVDGGHVWFPIYEAVRLLMEQSSFAGTVNYLHYTAETGESVLHDIDYSLGHVQRTPDHDARIQNPRRAMSIVLDAIKAP